MFRLNKLWTPEFFERVDQLRKESVKWKIIADRVGYRGPVESLRGRYNEIIREGGLKPQVDQKQPPRLPRRRAEAALIRAKKDVKQQIEMIKKERDTTKPFKVSTKEIERFLS